MDTRLQKSTGSYYTDSDVVSYINNHTIITTLFESFRLTIDFRYIRTDVYIYDKLSTKKYLPTEIEIEYKQRQKRFNEIKNSKLSSVSDFTLYNLDIEKWFFELLKNLNLQNKLKALSVLKEFKILEPSVGEGNFIKPIFNLLERIYLQLSNYNSDEIKKIILNNNLYGFDIREEAIEILNSHFGNVKTNFKVKNFLTEVDFDFKFDVIIGNPPYVEYSKVKDYKLTPHNSLKLSKTVQKRFEKPSSTGYKTAKCGNLYGFFIERSFQLLKRDGRLGMIVPMSIISTPRMKPVAELFKGKSFFSNFDTKPGKLFTGIYQRLSILLANNNLTQENYLTKYHRWYEQERQNLFEAKVNYQLVKNSFLKIGSSIELSILEKINSTKTIEKYILKDIGKPLYFHNAPFYWIRAMNFKPYFYNERDGEKLSTHMKELKFEAKHLDTILSISNSSLFYWWFIINSDGRHLNNKEIKTFPIDLDKLPNLELVAEELMEDYKKNSVRKNTVYKTTGVVIYDEFYPRKSKHIIDKIDRVLAKHYGFNKEEIEFIFNYDIKYRMGLNER